MSNPIHNSNPARSRTLPLVGIGVLVLGVVLALSVANVLIRDSSSSVASAQEFLAINSPELSDFREGDIYHTSVRAFVRFGPKAAVIQQSDSGYATEHHVRDVWLEIGPNQTIVRSYYRDSDDQGIPYQEAILTAERNLVVDLRSGKTLIDEPGAILPIMPPADVASELSDALAVGAVRVIELSDESLTVESRDSVSVPEISDDGYTVPYYVDLDPKEYVSRITVGDDGSILARYDFIVTAGGDEILVASEEITMEIVDSFPVAEMGELAE